jgi:hypothetical protein
MAYRGSAGAWNENTGDFDDVEPLGDISFLSRAPRGDFSTWAPYAVEGEAIPIAHPAVTVDFGGVPAALRTTSLTFPMAGLIGFPYRREYHQLQLLNPPNGTFFYNAGGEAVSTAEPGQPDTVLVLGDIGTFAAPYYNNSNPKLDASGRCEDWAPSSPAPLWWQGLSRIDLHFGQRPHAQNSACPFNDESCDAYFPNAAWIRRHLLNPATPPAPAQFLWHTEAHCERSYPRQATDSLLDPERAWLGRSNPFSDRVHRMAFTLPPPDDSAQINRAVLDAVELLCHYELEHDAPAADLLQSPPSFSSVADLPRVGQYFQELARAMNVAAGKLVFANVPEQALDALKLTPIHSAYPALGGEISKSISALRGALISLAAAAPGIAHEVEVVGNDMIALRGRLASLNLQRDRIRIENLASAVQRMNDCAAALMPSVSGGVSVGSGPNPVSFGYSVSYNTGAIFVCANAFSQIEFSGRIEQIDNDLLAQQGQDAIDDFARSMEERRDVMRRFTDDIRTANEVINEHLANLDGLQSRARRVVQRALFMQTEEAEAQAEISKAMRARSNLHRELYERALTNAKRMSFLAKRAIEQRLGMRLSEMHEDLPLVSAPASWEARVCGTSGVSAETFQELADAHPDSPQLGEFADQFIGDYVRNLENLVESYPLFYNFHEGQDTTVVSLRDDVANTKALCEVPTGNLLYRSGDLDRVEALADADPLDPGVEGWVLEDCAEDEDGVPLRDCIAVTELPADRPLADATPVGHQIEFGDNGQPCDYGNTANPNRCGYTGASVLRQDVLLNSGRYVLSWFGKNTGVRNDLVYLLSGSNTVLSGPAFQVDPASTAAWRRYYSVADVPVGQPASVVIGQPTTTPASVIVAGIMLEDLSRLPSGSAAGPRPYSENDTRLTRTIRACADTFGAEFKRNWRYRCAHLCPGGFSAACGSDAASTRCYYETSFTLSQREIEASSQLQYAGFAHGNFNYRLDSVAVNFVGTGTRDCDVTPSSSCYSAGFIPYSLEHTGPYTVRNHEGGHFDAKLFSGTIEHARGLAAERVLTNPLSSADRELLGDYLRAEFAGRPLDGTFTLRVWDEPGVSFSSIEDVQLVLGYRYWTRFE